MSFTALSQVGVAPGAPAAAVPEPIASAEAAVAAATPEALKPVESAVAAGFDAVLAEGVAQAPAEVAKGALVEPGVTALASDVGQIATGHGSLTPLIADAPLAFREAKAGYKTTEFWLTLIVIVLAQLGTLSLPGHYGRTITTAAAAAAYAISRGLAKAGVPSPV
jgi:hypothetical protein